MSKTIHLGEAIATIAKRDAEIERLRARIEAWENESRIIDTHIAAAFEEAAKIISDLPGDLYSKEMAVALLLKRAGHPEPTGSIEFHGYSDHPGEAKAKEVPGDD